MQIVVIDFRISEEKSFRKFEDYDSFLIIDGFNQQIAINKKFSFHERYLRNGRKEYVVLIVLEKMQ